MSRNIFYALLQTVPTGYTYAIGFIVGCGKVNCGNAAREGALGYDLGAPFVNHLHTRNRRGAQCAPRNRFKFYAAWEHTVPPYGVTCTKSFDTIYIIENSKKG